MHFFFKKHATISQDITRQRAANPPQSQNLILSIVTEVGCPPSLFNFPETWLVADRMMLCTTKNFVKSFSAQITSKCCKDGVSQPIKWEIFSIFPIAFPLLMRCFELICHLTSYILQWVTGKSQEADTALHMLVALHWSYNAWKLFCMYILPRNVGVPFFFFDEIYHLGASFQFWHDNLKWLKTEVISPGSEAQPTPQTRKRHTCNQLLAHLMHTCGWK